MLLYALVVVSREGSKCVPDTPTTKKNQTYHEKRSDDERTLKEEIRAPSVKQKPPHAFQTIVPPWDHTLRSVSGMVCPSERTYIRAYEEEGGFPANTNQHRAARTLMNDERHVTKETPAGKNYKLPTMMAHLSCHVI